MKWINELKPFAGVVALSLAAYGCGGDDDDAAAQADEMMPGGSSEMVGDDEPGAQGASDTPSAMAGDSSEPVVEQPSGQDIPVSADGPGNIVEVAQAAGDFETLLAAADAAGLVGALSGEGPLTVFAPTDDAFAALPDGALDALLADTDELAAVLSYHVIADAVPSAEIADGDDVDTLLGPWLDVSISGSSVTVGGAQVVITDIEASNGVIHVIDSVLLPPPPIGELAAGEEQLSTLVTALDAAGLVDTLNGEGPFTVFAPTNAAFEALPEGTVEALLEDVDALSDVLLYHVVSGRQKAEAVVSSAELMTLQGGAAEVEVLEGGVQIAGAQISVTDIQARNGVVHLLDAVMLPPAEPITEPDVEAVPDDTLEPELDTDAVDAPGNIVEVAAAAGTFETLLAAAEAAGLVETLSGEGPLTLFAPTDEAFAALPDGTVEALLADTDELAAVLTHHVVAGEVLANAIEDGARLDTALGPWLEFAVDGDGVAIGETRVVSADIAASNGVIHVIDRVLLPPDNIATIAAMTPELSTLVTALEAAGLVDTLNGEGPFTVFAPTNAAFDALPEGTLDSLLQDTDALSNVLLYHVVGSRQPAASVVAQDEFMMLSGQPADVAAEGQSVSIAGAAINTTDIVARNGVIHLLDAVMLPPAE